MDQKSNNREINGNVHLEMNECRDGFNHGSKEEMKELALGAENQMIKDSAQSKIAHWPISS